MKYFLHSAAWQVLAFFPTFFAAHWVASALTDHWLVGIILQMVLWAALFLGSLLLYLDWVFRRQWGHSFTSKEVPSAKG